MVVAPKTVYQRVNEQYLPRHIGSTRTGTKALPRKKGRYILSVVLVTFAVIVLLTRFAFIIESQYRVEKMKAEVSKIASENERLKVEVANLKSTARIERIAKANLKMQEPGDDQVIYLDR
ncbi:cell division protein FtsL [Thermosediminibacter litoriperuensis]|uniref:Cell division protein FtsL n=1 Tax=Thermosediminibacter litoriperuensis TaxID=291989 RepID=A0A5S5AUS0_9FIRM|nr:cell division protein FtsL [Thermosediminibacter litoriperuensis]TYP54949.1 cell division protein FtsL [Thermosediminibacter litoriperuensis]